MNYKPFRFLALGAALGCALAAPWLSAAGANNYLQAYALKSGENKEGTTFTFPAIIDGGDGKINFAGQGESLPDPGAEWTKGTGDAAFAYVIKITKPWSTHKAGEATLLALKFGKDYEFKSDANATSKTITIPEFVWAYDVERSGDEAFPSYKITAIADTVFKALTKDDGSLNTSFGKSGSTISAGYFEKLIISGRIPKILGSGKIKTYGLLKGEEANAATFDFEIKIEPTWAVLSDNKTVVLGSTFYNPAYTQVQGAESVVRDLQFGLSGDNRDLEVSKEDLNTLAAFIAPATPAVPSKDKGLLVKKSNATLKIGANLKSGGSYTYKDANNTDQTAPVSDLLPNKYLTLAPDAFKADSLVWRFASISIRNDVAGSLASAAFASLGSIHKLKTTDNTTYIQAPDFTLIDLADVNLKTEHGGVFAIDGDALFQGLNITTLTLPENLKTFGNKWFKNATITEIYSSKTSEGGSEVYTYPGANIASIGNEAFRSAFIGNLDKITAFGAASYYPDDNKYEHLSNPLSIGNAAFKAYKVFLKSGNDGPEANTDAGFSLTNFARATSIGDSAFADLTHAHLTFDGTEVEADASQTSLTDASKFYFYPVTDFGKLTLLNSLGKGVFAEDHIALGDGDLETSALGTGIKAIIFPSSHLASAPSAVFKGSAFIVKSPTETDADATKPAKIEANGEGGSTDEYILFKTIDTLAYKAFKIAGTLPGEAIALDAFPEDTIYVPYKSFEKWKYALTGSKLVVDYGFTPAGTIGNSVADWNVKIVAGSAGVPTNNVSSGLFEITYNFARNSRARTISFYNAYQNGLRHYSITGPTSAIGAVPGFLTLKADSSEKAIEITESFAEDGLVLDPFTPAGLYVIKVFGFSEPTTADALSKPTETYLLRVLPADLLRYTADTVELAYVGPDNVADALKHKFTIPYFAGLIHNEYGDEEDLNYDGADIKVYDDAALALKADAEVVDNVLVVKGKGSYVNELAIPLKYTPRSIAGVTFNIPPVDFKIGDKEFLIPGDLKFAVTEEDTIYTLTVPQTGGEDDTYITVAYDASTPTGKPGTVKVKLSGKGELTGSADETYEIKANWAAFAAFPTTGPKYQVSDIPVPFNGNAKSDLDGLVEPFLLTKDQYDVVATPENNEGTYSTSADVLKNKVDALYAAGRYDLYIIPQGDELTAKYKDAAYIGYYEIDKLSFEKFKDAFIVGKDEEGAFTLTVDKDVYADDFGAILAASGDTFTVTLSKKAESSIDGLPSNPFKFAIPTAEPTALEAINLHFDGVLYLVVGQSKDLNDYIKAANKDAAIDFKSFISYESDEPEKLAISGSTLSAIDKWNGEVTATYSKGSKTIKVTFPVKAVESEDKIPTPPTSVESIVKDAPSVSFIGSELIIKGLAGSVATVYGLNGGVVASFVVATNDASFPLNLGKGFYLVKVASSVTKFIIK